jgi:CDP-diacylglycerol--glycerol-3-phosphate 3-phosphatidyltransferase
MPNSQNPSPLLDKFWTIPNVLSVFRIFLIVPILDQLKNNTPESDFCAFLLIGVAYLTDFLDGFLARILKSSSKIGQILDPLGDKLLAITVSAVLYFGHKAPLYFFVLILFRDLIISFGAIYAMNIKKMIMLPILSGKVTTFVLGIVLGLYPLSFSFVMQYAPYNAIIKNVVVYGTYLASVMLILSGSFYSINYLRNFLLKKRETHK